MQDRIGNRPTIEEVKESMTGETSPHGARFKVEELPGGGFRVIKEKGGGIETVVVDVPAQAQN